MATTSTVVLPRTVGVVLRPARIFYGVGWRLWRSVSSRVSTRRTRQIFLTAFGPLSVFLLLGLWTGRILVAFALLHLGLSAHLNAPESQGGLGLLLTVKCDLPRLCSHFSRPFRRDGGPCSALLKGAEDRRGILWLASYSSVLYCEYPRETGLHMTVNPIFTPLPVKGAALLCG